MPPVKHDSQNGELIPPTAAKKIIARRPTAQHRLIPHPVSHFAFTKNPSARWGGHEYCWRECCGGLRSSFHQRKRSLLLTRNGLKFRVGQGANLRIPREHSRTGIPAQNGVVVCVRPEGLSSLEVVHRFAQGMISIGIA